jgi:hypothetical protein
MSRCRTGFLAWTAATAGLWTVATPGLWAAGGCNSADEAGSNAPASKPETISDTRRLWAILMVGIQLLKW